MIRTYRSTKEADVQVNKVIHWLNFRDMFRDYVAGQMFLEWKFKVVYLDRESAQRCRDNIKEAARLYNMLSSKESGLDKETLQSDMQGARNLFEIERRHHYGAR